MAQRALSAALFLEMTVSFSFLAAMASPLSSKQVVTVAALQVGQLLSGAVVVEQVFTATWHDGYAAACTQKDLEHNREQYVIGSVGLIHSLEDLRTVVIGATPQGVPITVAHLGEVKFGPRLRRGAASMDAQGEVAVGVALMLLGENSRTVTAAVKAKLAEIAPSLPPGVHVEPFYDRAALVDVILRVSRLVEEHPERPAQLLGPDHADEDARVVPLAPDPAEGHELGRVLALALEDAGEATGDGRPPPCQRSVDRGGREEGDRAADALDPHLLVAVGVEQFDALAAATGDADVVDGNADRLAAVCHQHELVVVGHREGGGDAAVPRRPAAPAARARDRCRPRRSPPR